MKNILFVILVISIISSCAVHKCCPDQFKWSHGRPPLSEFQYNIALTEGNKIYSLGGTNKGAFEEFDLISKKWTSLPSIPVPVAFTSGVIYDHAIYLMGGIDTLLNFSKAIQKFDLDQHRWIRMSDLNFPVSRAASVVYQNKIYLMGGLTGVNDKNSQNSSSLSEYDPETSIWKMKVNMPTARHGHAAITINNKILVAGGFTSEGETSIVEEYDPATDQWSRKADMPIPNAFFNLVVMDGNVFAMGGRIYQGESMILKYDVNADQWTQVGNLPEARNRFGMVAIGKLVYIIGGEENPKSLLIGKKN